MAENNLKIETICEKISSKANYSDPSLMKAFYVGLIKVIMDELRLNNKIYLPRWGYFRVKEMKSRNIRVINSDKKMRVPGTKQVKFEPCRELKYYVRYKI